MKCDRIRPKISPYLDGELEPAERRDVDAHLEDCPDCSLFYEELVALDRELQSLGRNSSDPKSFRAELLEKANRDIPEDPFNGGEGKDDGGYTEELAYVTATIMLGLGLILGGYLSVGLISELRTARQPLVENQAVQNQNVPARTEAPRFFQASSFSDAYFEVADARSTGSAP
jgi:hypothetical protein